MWSLAVFLFSLSAASANDLHLQELRNSLNKFTPTIYKEIAKFTKNNFILSPLSAENVLSLLQTGARGETAEELRTNLHLPNVDQEFEATLKNILPSLRDDDYDFRSANKLYLQPKFKINEGFKKTATDTFHAETENIDFTQREAAAQTINKWVENKTNNRIKNLVDANTINNQTRSILVNALFFKADWLLPFPFSITAKADFYKNEKEVVQVDTMRNVFGIYNYFECSHLNAKFLELKFAGSEASLTIILPNERTGIVTLENKIDAVFKPHNLTVARVLMAIPKFKIESEIDLKKVLTGLGVTKIFDGLHADLSGIAGIKGDLIVDNIVQKSFIKVNEEGVEAASATYADISIPLMGFSDPPKNFVADHPFIWYITVKNLILFAGRVVAPDQ